MRRLFVFFGSCLIVTGVLTGIPAAVSAAPAVMVSAPHASPPASSIADLRARCRLAAVAYNTKCVLGMNLFTLCREYRNNFAYDIGTIPSRGLMRCRLSQSADGSGRDWFWGRWNRL